MKFNIDIMRNVLLLLILFTVSCSQGPAPSGPLFDLSEYETFTVNGTATSYALQQAENGKTLNEGMVDNGTQNGVWMTYYNDDDNRIKTIANYVNGNMNGPYLEMNNRGQIEKRITYLNNQIHGLYAEYKFGRPLKEFMYDDGVLNGLSKEYSDRGKLIKETNYKNGQLDGTIKQYDEAGNIILEYVYKNGEKISGGIVKTQE